MLPMPPFAPMLAYVLGSLLPGRYLARQGEAEFSTASGPDLPGASAPDLPGASGPDLPGASGPDLPGASGTVRRFGWGAGAFVFAFDVGKGALAARLWGAHPLSGAAVVAGHCFPLPNGRGGGMGLAPLLGFTLLSSPRAAAMALLAAGALALPYRRWLQARLGLNVVPAVSGPAVLAALLAARPGRERRALLLAAAVLAVRAGSRAERAGSRAERAAGARRA